MRTFTARERDGILDEYRQGRPLTCPACDVPLDQRTVPPSSLVSYVRDRLVVLCPKCGAHAALDRPGRNAGA